MRNTDLSLQNVNQQLNMSTQVSKNSLISSYQNYLSARQQLEAAQSYQRLIEKGYKEGLNSFIETIDARNQLTSAELSVRLNLYRVLAAEANLERETASYPLNWSDTKNIKLYEEIYRTHLTRHINAGMQ